MEEGLVDLAGDIVEGAVEVGTSGTRNGCGCAIVIILLLVVGILLYLHYSK